MTDVNWKSFVPANIERLKPYEPGKPIEELERELGISGAIKVASNENPLGPSPLGMAAAERALREMNRYPDGGAHRLRHKLAARLGVAPAELLFGAGSVEIIDMLVRTFCDRQRHAVLTHQYAFVMYRVSCMANAVDLVEAPVTSDLRCDVDAVCSRIDDRTRLIFLPNPNNPTGHHVTTKDFERLLAKLPKGVLLVVDEAYHEYAAVRDDYPVAERYRKDHPLIVSLRTFSKIYGLASLRIGYAIADEKVVAYLNRVRSPFNVSQVAQEAALAAMDDEAHVERSRRLNAEGIEQLTRGLARLAGVTVFPSAANFVLVDFGRDVGPVYDALLRRGVIVRPMTPAGLLRHARISVGTREENERTLAAVAAVLGEGRA